IADEWTKVFKPKGEVPPQILALTGITLDELAAAQDFEIYREELKAKLKDAVIVGHNVQFDIKFLEGLGIEFSGQVIDT
ncbi:3'-5' exonuclease, partial [Staphylococcus aureus]|nr:3'-5' exonuclease [Staphylococcus aureus]